MILLIVSLVIGAAHLSSAEGDVGFMTDPGLLAANLLLIQNYFPDGVTTGIGPAWSLSVEVIFYLSLPLLAFGAQRVAPRIGRLAASLAPAALLLALGLVGKAGAQRTLDGGSSFSQTFGSTWHAVLERSFLASADLFAFGMAAAVALLLVQRGQLTLPRRLVGGLALVLAGVSVIAQHSGHLTRYFDTPMALAAALLLLYVTLPGRERSVSRALEVRPIVYLGVVSYSIYLWHEPIIYWLSDHGLTLEGRAGLVVNMMLVAAIVVLMSSATYRWVERPAMNRRRRTPTHAASMEAAP